VLVDEAIDMGLKIDDELEDAVFQAAPCQFSKEAFHSV
jgi:hypothetical protein